MELKEFLNSILFETDNLTLTIYQASLLIITLFLTWLVLRLIKKVMNRNLRKSGKDVGSYYALFKILSYFIWILVVGIALETIGVKFNLLIASSAALLVGLGLGLQQIFNDYVSGLLILFEGNLKVNDIIQIEDEIVGRVVSINLRTSKIETRDDIVFIVPNHKLINENIVNWTHMKSLTRFNIRVGVAYGSDTELVEKVLLSCASNHPEVTESPKPFVRFVDFGSSSLDFQLFFWTAETFGVENIKSNLRFRIDNEFRKNDIRIPFPQTDVHIMQGRE